MKNRFFKNFGRNSIILIFFLIMIMLLSYCGPENLTKPELSNEKDGFNLTVLFSNGNVSAGVNGHRPRKLTSGVPYSCPPNADITLYASPNDEYTFVSWEGDLLGYENPKETTMDMDKLINANFKRNTYYVSKLGNDTTGDGSMSAPYLTIGKALTDCSNIPGEKEIRVSAGLYNEQVSLLDNVSLKGGWNTTFTDRNYLTEADRNNPIYKTEISSSSTIIVSGSTVSITTAVILEYVASTLEGFTITSSIPSSSTEKHCYAVYIYNGNVFDRAVNINNNTITATVSNSVAESDAIGIYSYDTTTNIDNNIISANNPTNWSYGLRFYSGNSTITNNSIVSSGYSASGILKDFGTSTIIKNNNITAQAFYYNSNAYGQGIICSYISSANIINNIINVSGRNSSGIRDINCPANIINNIINVSSYYGNTSGIESGDDTIIVNNIVNCSGSVVRCISNTGYAIINNNTIRASSSARVFGIINWENATSKIINNLIFSDEIIYGTGYGVENYLGLGTIEELNNNDIIGFPTALVYDGSDYTTIADVNGLSYASGNISEGTSSTLFVNYANGDYHLRSRAPINVIGGAMDLGKFIDRLEIDDEFKKLMMKDKDGKGRTSTVLIGATNDNAGRWSMGAYEQDSK